jgi:hypothetical protein
MRPRITCRALVAGVAFVAAAAVGAVVVSAGTSTKHSARLRASGLNTTYYTDPPATRAERPALAKLAEAQAGCPETLISTPGEVSYIRRLPLALALRCGHFVADPGTAPGLARYCQPHEEDRWCPYPAARRIVDVYASRARLLGACTTDAESSEGNLICTEEAATPARPRRVGVYSTDARLLGYCTPNEASGQRGGLVCTEPSS